jgi:hypothetical protein
VADPTLADGVAEGVDDVVLTHDLGEAAGPVPAVERLPSHATGDATGLAAL